jgi:hypothetical protein
MHGIKITKALNREIRLSSGITGKVLHGSWTDNRFFFFVAVDRNNLRLL